jgi:hypothetical protein
MNQSLRSRLPAAVVLAFASAGPLLAAARPEPAPARPAPVRVPLPEARRLVELMDDIYHAGVLTTHQMYVQEPGLPAAVTWAKQVIGKVKARGWPEARIFAATDRPLNPDNNPVDPFERAAIAAFRAGKPNLEKVEGDALRYASPIRVVDRSCLTCHVRNREGDLLGGVSYRVLLERK